MKLARPLTLALIAIAALALGALAVEEAQAPTLQATAASRQVRDESFRRAAAALRRGDLATAESSLASILVEEDGGRATLARRILGLAANRRGEHERALAYLHASPGGPLEDWRLLAVAQSAAAVGDGAAAGDALEEIQTQWSGSPVYPHALLARLEKAAADGDLDVARRVAEAARGSSMPPEERLRVEQTLLELGRTAADSALQREAALSLLVHHPLEASKERVVEIVRNDDGAVPWPDLLPASALRQRAENLSAIGISGGALDALEAIPPDERDFDWLLQYAATLTLAERGSDALAALGAQSPSASREVDWLWERANAALEAATARSTRNNLPSAQREHLKQAALRDLRRIAGGAPDNTERAKALRQLAEEIDLDADFQGAIETWSSLRALDPEDTSGARPLFAAGWKSYVQGNYSGAIGTWRELLALYPESRFSRGGLYWSARAHAALGDRERSRALYEQLTASSTVDFYSRHALRRLGRARPPRRVAQGPLETWPIDSVLERAEWLSDLGLDEIALEETLFWRPHSDARANHALEALVRSRSGERRTSIHALVRAFDGLGSVRQHQVPTPAQRMYYPLDFANLVGEHAQRHGLPKSLVFAIIRQESAFDAQAVSRSGARGLMQLMPATGKELAQRFRLRYSRERLHDPDFSIRLGTSYFKQVLDMFDGDVELALAGYNGGPYRIRRWWREAGSGAQVDRFVESLPLEETKRYVQRILLFSDSYEQLYGSDAESGYTPSP